MLSELVFLFDCLIKHSTESLPQKPIVHGALFGDIDASGSLWQIESDTITIHFEKKSFTQRVSSSNGPYLF